VKNHSKEKMREKHHRKKTSTLVKYEITAARKIANYLMRKYQRARDNAEETEINKVAYFAQNAKYPATIKGRKANRGKNTVH